MSVVNAALPAVLPGFADPVHDSQRVFSEVMKAMARPGRIHTPKIEVRGPEPINQVAAQVLLVLADHETSIWLDRPALASESLANWLRFHCGAPIAGDTQLADFALVTDPGLMPPLCAFAQGTPEFPDRSATVLVQVETLMPESGWHLTGPGVETKHRLRVDGLGSGFIKQWRQNRALFPLGVDIVFCAPDALACLPRTTEIREA